MVYCIVIRIVVSLIHYGILYGYTYSSTQDGLLYSYTYNSITDTYPCYEWLKVLQCTVDFCRVLRQTRIVRSLIVAFTALLAMTSHFAHMGHYYHFCVLSVVCHSYLAIKSNMSWYTRTKKCTTFMLLSLCLKWFCQMLFGQY